MDIKVSVIIPVYNVENYLEECLNSAVNQTLKEIEIIAINDGSTDCSLEILNKYKSKYKNFSIINQENRGLSGARNSGLRVSKGKYVYFLDSDDYINKDAMEICYKEAEKYKLDIVTFDASSFYDNFDKSRMSEDYDRSNKLKSEVMNGEDFYIYANSIGAYYAPVWLNFYNREYIEKNGLYFYEGILHEDEIHTSQSFIKASRVKYIAKKFFNRRIRPNSIMTSPISLERIEGNYTIAEETYNFIKKNNFKSYTVEILLAWIRVYYSNCIRFCDALNFYDKRKIIESKINEKHDVMNIDLDLQINCPILYYS